MKITGIYDMPMSGLPLYSLDGLGCGCSNTPGKKQREASGIIDPKAQLQALHDDIVSNPNGYN